MEALVPPKNKKTAKPAKKASKAAAAKKVEVRDLDARKDPKGGPNQMIWIPNTRSSG
jgi:hypothetical protein